MRFGVTLALCWVLALGCDSAGERAGGDGDGSGAGNGASTAGSPSSPGAGAAAGDPGAGSGAPIGVSDPANGGPDDLPPEDGSGQTGSIGASPMCDAEQCAAEAASVAAELAAPAAWSRTFEGGRCELVVVSPGDGPSVSGPACVCDTGGGGSIFIGPEGLGCHAFGRAGDCLRSDDEWDGCSIGRNDACDESCEELEARYAEDAATEFDVEVRYSECGVDGFCHRVLRIGDRCYADRSYETALAFDCADGDAEILAAYLESQMPEPVPSCDQIDPDQGGTCFEPPPLHDDCVERPAGEWQGQLVCAPYPPCERPDGCGLALACIDNVCSACTEDAQCAPGEGCALDHCLLEANIGCRSRSDCSDDALCILSGYTGGTPRSNEDMRAYCLSASGGSPMPGG